MKVFKFGGASIANVKGIENMRAIMRHYPAEEILIVISAMGKTTNALEKVAEEFYNGNKNDALTLFEVIKNKHLDTANYLLIRELNQTVLRLRDIFTEIEWLLHDKPVRGYDYYYDQIVCAGELMSSCIISAYLNESGIMNNWIDVRDLFRTDNNFRDAAIDWEWTQKEVDTVVLPLLQNKHRVVTQGFIGSTSENESATLGREGSDYSAAVFANMLNASALTIWKDVEGVMNADPKMFANAVLLPELNYEEVIEMAYYGAQVIHPKTIKPLQNKNIPLYVKCFLDIQLPGTIIHNGRTADLPPIIVVKENQALMHLYTRDFSFAGEQPVADLYQILSANRIQPNLLQTAAIRIDICLDDRPEKIEKLASGAFAIFNVDVEKNLTLLTIRHYREDIIEQYIAGKKIRLRQQSPDTVQLVLGL